MQREMESQDCDARIEKVYGPMPPTVRNTIKEEKDENKKRDKEEVVEEKRGFFARLFGKKRS